MFTDFVFRVVPSVRIEKSIHEPDYIRNVFPDWVEVEQDLPSFVMFADLVLDSESGRLCGFSFQFDSKFSNSLMSLIRFADRETTHLHQRKLPADQLSFTNSDLLDHRINIVWSTSVQTKIVIAQLDEVQWVTGSPTDTDTPALIGVCCPRISEATESLFV